jgi:hypothetical protein
MSANSSLSQPSSSVASTNQSTDEAAQMKSEDRQKCLCRSKVCGELQNKILVAAPEGHPWVKHNGFTEIWYQSGKYSLTVDALQQSCAFHLEFNKNDKAQAKYIICKYPLAPLLARRRIKMSITFAHREGEVV